MSLLAITESGGREKVTAARLATSRRKRDSNE